MSVIFKNTYFEEHLRTTLLTASWLLEAAKYLFELNNKDKTTSVEITLVHFIVDILYVCNKLVVPCLPRL